jgi:hypothetical protein
MGNILITQTTLEQWRKESITANNLLNIDPINSQEREVIRSAGREQQIKKFIGLLLGMSFCMSLKRYFPGIQIIDDNLQFFLLSGALIVPVYIGVDIYTNKEIILKLQVIRNNHDILNS